MKTAYPFFACCFLLAVGSTGCEAYANAANGVLNSGVMKISDGTISVKNALSVPVCKITVFNSQDQDRSANDLQGKELPPGADGSVDIPHVGKAEEPTPPGLVYGMRVYACQDRTAYTKEPGALIATINPVDAKDHNVVVIH